MVVDDVTWTMAKSLPNRALEFSGVGVKMNALLPFCSFCPLTQEEFRSLGDENATNIL